jgi:hypothetical protein
MSASPTARALASRPSHRPTLLLAALSYAVAGWPVLPLHTLSTGGVCSCRRVDCSSPGKHPRTRHGFQDASTSPSEIAAWWARWPEANVGVRTGELVVIDLDCPSAEHALTELQAQHAPLPPTRRARTGRGQHLYFHADGHRIGCSAGTLAPGIDVRGHGGFIVAPPSRHANGHHYTWTTQHPVAPLPQWLATILCAPTQRPERSPLPAVVAGGMSERAQRYLQVAAEAELAAVQRATQQRNTTLNRAAFRLGQLLGVGLGDRSQLAEALLDAALSTGLGEREARATIASGLSAGERNPRPHPAVTRRR